MIRAVNAILTVVLLIIAVDTLMRLLNANPGNVIVGLFRTAANWLLAPFNAMFSGQSFLLTALIGAVFYWLIALLIRRITPRRAY